MNDKSVGVTHAPMMHDE
jgi:myosin I